MSRQNDGPELFKRLDSLQVFRQVSGGGSTTLAAAATAQATTLNLTTNTGFTAADPVIVSGDGGVELNAISATTPITAVPLVYKLGRAQALGATVVEAVAASLAHITEDGIDFGGNQSLDPIYSALSSAAIAYLYGNTEYEGAFTLQGFNIQNFHTWMGITEAETGAGSSADPFQGVIHGALMATQGIQCLRATGVRHDGKNVIVDFNDAKIAPSGQTKLARSQGSGFLPCTFKCTSAIIRIWS